MSVRAWLPQDAFGDPLVAGALAPMLDGWSKRWFAGGLALEAACCGEAADAPPRRSKGVVSLIALSGAGKRAILERALGLDLSARILQAGDHRLLDAFVLRIVDDLLATLDDALGEGDDAPLVIALRAGGEAMLTLTLPRAALAAAIRRAVAPVLPRPALAVSRSAALREQIVDAEGVLGSAEFTLNEVRTLSVGDVLILERDLKAPVDFRLAGETRPLRRGQLGRDGDRVTIRING